MKHKEDGYKGGGMLKGLRQNAPIKDGVELPSRKMDYTRSEVGEQAPTIGPRTA